MLTVYVSIGNSDDKLAQREWAAFVNEIDTTVRTHAAEMYGHWFSAPAVPWQNCCWCIGIHQHEVDSLRAALTEIRTAYRQDSVAWAPVSETDFI
ncbi:hypothetical protein [Sphaerimonospora mesophila]|uniref:hypothetical protein n=1 Tax=Sphaerimonospora mesophila TaxID=37483 RepID=UPI0006E464BA